MTDTSDKAIDAIAAAPWAYASSDITELLLSLQLERTAAKMLRSSVQAMRLSPIGVSVEVHNACQIFDALTKAKEVEITADEIVRVFAELNKALTELAANFGDDVLI